MPATTFLATAPDGSVLTRKSGNRTYTHAILCRWSYEESLASADRIEEQDKRNFDWHVEKAASTPEQQKASYTTEEQMLRHRAIAAGFADRNAYAEAMRQERVSRVNESKAKGVYDTFGALTWCGRPDLAQKELAKYRNRPGYVDVTMVAVTIKAKKGGAQ